MWIGVDNSNLANLVCAGREPTALDDSDLFQACLELLHIMFKKRAESTHNAVAPIQQ